ncbi:MAG TPA: DHH family phosphoesterase, partial [Candidatus Methanoperedenaceae archaeon]|nr:DHH family phosphoesterase [Candidatus Methanoperedenaceae archaeon]
MLDELIKLGKNASSMLGTCKYVRVLSHNDTDGVAAAGVMCNALHRIGIIFHCSILPQLDQSVAERVNREQSDAVVFCDMGSGQPDVISKIRDRVLVIDHHIPYGKLECLHVNPHLSGINGANEISASGTAYLVAREMGDNRDLAGLALTGAVGDKQEMAGANGAILEDAVKSGAVTVSKGLRIGDGNIEELLEYTLDPYLDVTGDRDGIRGFLSDINVRGDVNGLEEDARRRLASAMVLRLAKRAAPEALNLVVGDVYRLNREVIPNIFDFSNVLNTCGKLEKPGLGIALCLRDRAPLDEALRLMKDEQRALVKLIRDAEPKVRTCANLRYLM